MPEINLDWNYIDTHRVEGKRDRVDVEIYCPSCGAENFKINKRTGQYNGYGCNCMSYNATKKQIAKSLLLPNFTPQMPIGSRKPQLKRSAMNEQMQQIQIRKSEAQSSAIIYNPPAWGTQAYRNLKRTIAKECKSDNVTLREVREIRFPYGLLPNGQFKCWVSRFEWTNQHSNRDKAIARYKRGKTHEKTIRQGRVDEEGAIRWSKGEKSWEPYRIEDALAATGNALLIVEGETATDAMYRMGLAAVTLQGNTWGEVKTLCDRIPESDLLIFLTDADEEGDAKGEKFVKACEKEGRKAIALSMRKLVPELTLRIKGCDAADVETNNLSETFIERLEREIPLILKAQKNIKNEKLNINKLATQKESDVNRAIRLIEQILGSDKICRNEMSKAIELESEPGKQFKLRDLWFKIQTVLNENISLNFLEQVGAVLADSNPYNPIANYLQSCPTEDVNFISNLSTRFLGNNKSISDTMVRKFLVGAVARVFQPGCKMDCALILKGDQGIGKSSFFRELAGVFFNDSMGDISDKDDLLTAHAGWINEWPELETIFTRADVSKTKSFLSRMKDFLRLPYGRNVEEFPRHFVIAGTTNEDSFLRDPTGSRRFWIVEMFSMLNIEQLRKDRDRIWGAAVAAYRAGESWILTKEEQLEADRIAAQFNSQDPWEEAIAEHLANWLGGEISVKQILDKVLGIELAKQTVQLASRVGRILVGLGWKKIRKRVNGVRQYLYQIESDPPTHSVSSSDTECVGNELTESEETRDTIHGLPENVTKSNAHKSQVQQEVQILVTGIPVTEETPDLSEKNIPPTPTTDNFQRMKVLSKQIKGLLVLEDIPALSNLRNENLDIWQDAIQQLNPQRKLEIEISLEQILLEEVT